jgi:hypothetical protein
MPFHPAFVLACERVKVDGPQTRRFRLAMGVIQVTQDMSRLVPDKVAAALGHPDQLPQCERSRINPDDPGCSVNLSPKGYIFIRTSISWRMCSRIFSWSWDSALSRSISAARA